MEKINVEYYIVNNIPTILKYSSRITSHINIKIEKYWVVISYGKYQKNNLIKLLNTPDFITSIEKVNTQNPYNSNNSTLYLTGKRYYLQFDNFDNYNKKHKYFINEDENILHIKSNGKNKIMDMQKSLEIIAKKCISDLYLETVNMYFSKYQNELSQIKLLFRYMNTRWGVNKINSSNSNRLLNSKITINTKLIHYPKEFIVYVLQHEIVHCFYPHHGKEYYQMLKNINPEYKIFDKKLKNYNFI